MICALLVVGSSIFVLGLSKLAKIKDIIYTCKYYEIRICYLFYSIKLLALMKLINRSEWREKDVFKVFKDIFLSRTNIILIFVLYVYI